MNQRKHSYLKRLPAQYYRGHAYVHWSMTMEDRSTGWLTQGFHNCFREILIHTLFRHAITCPIYCCMPDHIHLLWMGILESSDQRTGMQFLRKHLNRELEELGMRLQSQPYDRVLKNGSRNEKSIEDLVEYIARNPERKGLVPPDRYRDYAFTGAIVPGYPELRIWDDRYWDRFWATYSYLRKNGLLRLAASS